jgi:dephospho-CoA kinase
MKKTIGITGGIGSGKSFVCEIIQKMGYPVYNSDNESKKIVDSDLEIRQALNTLFSKDLFEAGTLDRVFLAEKIFASDEIRLQVNNIIHPKVRAYFNAWKEKQQSNLLFNEAAILFETDAYKNFDKMILVTAPIELKIERVMHRDHCSKLDVEQRMAKQWSDEQKIPLADFIVENDGQPVLIQVERIIGALQS